jgi:hypothetical protein
MTCSLVVMYLRFVVEILVLHGNRSQRCNLYYCIIFVPPIRTHKHLNVKFHIVDTVHLRHIKLRYKPTDAH